MATNNLNAAEIARAPQRTFIDSMFTFLSSLKLAIILLILIAIVCVLGTVILQAPQVQPEQIQRTYAPATIKLFNMLGFFDLFHSWWFVALLTLLGLNLIFCSIDLFPTSWDYYKNPKRDASERFVEAQQFKEKIRSRLGPEELDHRIRSLFGNFSLSVSSNVLPDRNVFFAQKHLWWRFSVYFIHSALLVIFAGGIIGARLGYEGDLILLEGEKADKLRLKTGRSMPLGFQIKCNAARFEFRKDLPGFVGDPLNPEHVKSAGLIKSWYSDMTVYEEGKKLFDYTIIVNKPLNYKGLKLYQATFGITADFKHLTLGVRHESGSEVKMVDVAAGKLTSVPGTDIAVRVLDFIPDMSVQNNQPISRSGQFFDPVYSNPAARLEVIKGGGERIINWVFMRPEFRGLHKPEGLDYVITIENVTPRYYTGLQVAHDPGIPIVYAGFAMFAVSLILRFYFAHKRYWVVVKREKDSFLLYVGGNTSRNRPSFEREFNRFVSELKAAVQA